MIYDKDNISDFVNKDELSRSEQLGIKYDGVKHKFLISYEFPQEIIDGILNGKYKYEIKEGPLTDTYLQVTFSVPSVNYSKIYYFNKGFVSPSAYHTELWTKMQSKYFKFRISEPRYFNDYCIKRLDDFVDSLCNLLDVEPERRKLLEKQKIYYTLCNDQDEVEKITGFKSKGMALLASDEVVTSYQTHFHEVAHLLMNFKLQNLGLYTLPFFMEGFAVAVGGRGGMAPRVVTDIGYYLQQTRFLTYDSIITNEQFYNNDASMTYAVSGLYNMFLLSELGAGKYLELYKKVNGSLDYVMSIKAIDLNLHSPDKFIMFADEYENNRGIVISGEDTKKFEKPDKPEGKITDKEKYFGFCVKYSSSVRLKSEKIINGNYESRLFIEKAFSNYTGQQYYIKADVTSVKIYNCFNDELIASFDKSFAVNSLDVPNKDGYFLFSAEKSLFDFNLYKDGLLRSYVIEK